MAKYRAKRLALLLEAVLLPKDYEVSFSGVINGKEIVLPCWAIYS